MQLKRLVAVAKAEDERKRLEAVAKAKAAEEEKKRLEAVAKAKAAEEEKKRLDAVANAEEERKRLEAVAKAKAAEEEMKRLEAVAKAKADDEEKKRLEAVAKAKAADEEKKRFEAAAKAKAADEEKKRLEAVAKAKAADEEKKRIEAAAKAKAADEEMKRLEAVAKAEKERIAEEERKRLEAIAKVKAEEERKRLEATTKAEKERIAEEERKRLEAIAKVNAEEERKRLEAVAKVKAEEERKAAESKLKREQLELEVARKEKELKTKIAEAEAKLKHELELETARKEKIKLEAEAVAKIEADAKKKETQEKIRSEAKAAAAAETILERARRKLLGARLVEQKNASDNMLLEEKADKILIAEELRIAEEQLGNDAEINIESSDDVDDDDHGDDDDDSETVVEDSEKNDSIINENDEPEEEVMSDEEKRNKELAEIEKTVKAKAEEAAAAEVEAKKKEEEEDLRIRGAYLDWCLEFSKKPDKIRIKQFKNNYLLLEGVAKEEGKAIKLNEYADFTGAEFEKEMQAKEEAKEKEKQERLRKEQEEVEAAFAAAGGDVGIEGESEIAEDSSSDDEFKVEDEDEDEDDLYRVQDENGISGGKGEDDDVPQQTKGKALDTDTEEEWWKQEEGLDESMLQIDDIGSSNNWSGANGGRDENQSRFMSEPTYKATSSSPSKVDNQEQAETNADDPEVRKRVRAAYSNWCRTYKKEPDEGRFPKFKSNYIIMEKLANDQGREVTLNEFADCTPDEYETAYRAKSGRIEPEVKTSSPKVETKRVVRTATTRNIDINRKTEVDEEHDEAAANAEVEKIALAKAEEAAKRVEEIRKGKMEHEKANPNTASENRVEKERQLARQEEAARIEARRIAIAKANAKKVEEERLRREWQEDRAESRKTIADEERLRKQQQQQQKVDENISEVETKRDSYEDRQRNGRNPAFTRTETSRSRNDNDDTVASRSDLSPDEDTQPVVKPPPSKPKNPFQPRPTFTSSLKDSMRSNINEEGGFGGYRSSWRDQARPGIDDDDTNGTASESDSKYESPNDFMAPPKSDETPREAFENRSFFPKNSSNPSPSVQKPGSNYFMDSPSTNDEELFDSSFSLNQGSQSENWSSPTQDPLKQPRPTLQDPPSGNNNNNGDSWFGNSNSNRNRNNEVQPSTSGVPSADSYSQRGPLLNKGASYLENLSASPSTDRINGEDSYSNDDTSPEQYSQQPDPPPQSAFTERIQAAYRDWCQYYGKDYSEDRLRTFSANFLAVEKYHRETGVSLILNELADMTSEEFQKGRT
jgi:hypothetical protein